jgi:hypothetical protein
MNSKSSNIKITIHSLLIKQLIFSLFSFSFSFLSLFSFCSPLFFFFSSFLSAITVKDCGVEGSKDVGIKASEFLPANLVDRESRFWSHDRPTAVDAVIPSYHSTYFMVHRHWLALTLSLPFSQWYSDETSPWTLDYPPFFAYFERVLSIFANLIDTQIVHLQEGLNYSSDTVVLFQRIAMILSDLCLLYGVYRLTKDLDSRRQISIWVLIIWSLMLVIVDHMHFQYNGFLLGL